MLMGQKEVTIDDKGRLVLPSLFRDRFQGGESYASLGLDHCIELYPKDVYEEKAKKIMSLNSFDDAARRVQRTFLGNTFLLQIDSHNRILLPKELSTMTGLGKKATVIGMYDHLEIWDQDKYLSRAKEEQESFAQDASSLMRQGNGNL